jgi:hypothetical protein
VGIKLMIYQMQLSHVGMSRDGRVMDVILPIVDCPKPSLGKVAAIQNCLECESCKEMTQMFVNCDYQSKQQADQMVRQQNRPTEMPKDVPPGVFNPPNKPR